MTASATPSTSSALASPTTAAPTTISTTRSASSTHPFQSLSSATSNTTLGASTPSPISIPSATSVALASPKVSRIANPLIVGTTVGAVAILLLSMIDLVSYLRFRRKQRREQSWRASGSTFGSWRHSFKSVLRPHHRASATTTVAHSETARSSNTLVPFSAEQYSNDLRDLADPRLVVHELPTEAEKTHCTDTPSSDLLNARLEEEASDATSDGWEVGMARVVRVGRTP